MYILSRLYCFVLLTVFEYVGLNANATYSNLVKSSPMRQTDMQRERETDREPEKLEHETKQLLIITRYNLKIVISILNACCCSADAISN